MSRGKKNNLIIREAMEKYHVFLYEVAELLEVSEPTIVRWLRHELPAARQKAIATMIRKKATDEKIKAFAKYRSY